MRLNAVTGSRISSKRLYVMNLSTHKAEDVRLRMKTTASVISIDVTFTNSVYLCFVCFLSFSTGVLRKV